MRTTHHHLCKNFGRLIAACAVFSITVPGPGGQVTAQSAQNDDIVAYDDFSGTPAQSGTPFNLQWFKQGTPDAPPPGLVESLSVSISRDSEASADPQ